MMRLYPCACESDRDHKHHDHKKCVAAEMPQSSPSPPSGQMKSAVTVAIMRRCHSSPPLPQARSNGFAQLIREIETMSRGQSGDGGGLTPNHWPLELLTEAARLQIFYSHISPLVLLLNERPAIVNELFIRSYCVHSLPALRLLRLAGHRKNDTRLESFCRQLDSLVRFPLSMMPPHVNSHRRRKVEAFKQWHRNPLDLKSLARICVRIQLGNSLERKLTEAEPLVYLPLPLKNFILLRDEERLLRPSSVSDHYTDNTNMIIEDTQGMDVATSGGT